MSDHVNCQTDDDITIITIHNPPVNALKRGIPAALTTAIEHANENDSVRAIILIGAGRTFVAGADINELGQVAAGESQMSDELPNLLTQIEASVKPVVVAIHGNCLGGGMELALACHYRVAVAEAKLGQPEVKIGLIPGAHGTQRLPRLCGIAKAAQLCAVGNSISASEALELGIIDSLIEDDLLIGALRYTRESAVPAGPRKTSELNDLLGSDPDLQSSLTTLSENMQRKTRGQIAPAKAIEAVQLAATLPFDAAIAREREIFQQCISSPQCQGLIHAFFGHRTVSKIPGITPDTPRQSIEQAAIVGAGTMGGGITMLYQCWHSGDPQGN